MDKQVLYAVLALGLLATAGAGVARHLLNPPSVGYHSPGWDQAQAPRLTADKHERRGFAARDEVWGTSMGIGQCAEAEGQSVPGLRLCR